MTRSMFRAVRMRLRVMRRQAAARAARVAAVRGSVEIRDQETARIAMQASLTGHLVLSTLHTNDACSAIERLLDLGAEPFLVASSLRAVLAQRLVRRLHPACDGRGCAACGGTGYRGRLGVFELLDVRPQIQRLIQSRAPAADISAAAREAGLRPLALAAQDLIEQRLTTELEVARVIAARESDL